MTTGDFFAKLVAALESAGVPYMLTGSFASSAHGSPRATRDIDIVIAPDRDQLTRLVDALAGTSIDIEAANFAFDHGGMFNALDFESGWRVDFIMRKDREFSRREFERRRKFVLSGVEVSIASPEDLIVAKLEWAKEGQSERQIEDAAGIVAAQRENLDLAYVEDWVQQLALGAQWQEALRRVRLYPPR